jgi:hypothetical protein
VNGNNAFFSLANHAPAGVTRWNSGLIPNRSRAPKATRSRASQMTNANIPRSRDTAACPHWW